MKYLAVLGRQPKLSMAELEALFGQVQLLSVGKNKHSGKNRQPLVDKKDVELSSAGELAEITLPEHHSAEMMRLLEAGVVIHRKQDNNGAIGSELNGEIMPNLARLGGTLKIARELPGNDVIGFLVQLAPGRKLVIGVSDYTSGAKKNMVIRLAMHLKKQLVQRGRSVRILKNEQAVLGTATVLHNNLGRKVGRIELLKVGKKWYIGLGVQDITAYARRDQARPARDAKVGMLPPKLAQILINLCGPLPQGARLLDPFCGTGVLLQEAVFAGYVPYGSDLDVRMVKYARRNLQWLAGHITRDMKVVTNEVGLSRLLTNIGNCAIIEGDARYCHWEGVVDAVACETYLGSPMSVTPDAMSLQREKQCCAEIILGFLHNVARQVRSGTPLCLAIPAWLQKSNFNVGGKDDHITHNGSYSRLDILDEIERIGYNVIKFKTASQRDLLYHRVNQVVAREIIVLRKK